MQPLFTWLTRLIDSQTRTVHVPSPWYPTRDWKVRGHA
jgi:hypothetical protein